MKAIWFKDEKVSFVDRPRPRVHDREVLISPLLAGICNTDLELFDGYYGFEGTAGHEFVGVAEESPGNPELKGKRVVAEINIGCGRCSTCKGGDQRHCTSRRVIGIKDWDGAFAEYLKVPVQNLRVVNEAISDEEAVFTEPLAAALQVSQQIHLRPSSRTAVLGDGKLGLLIALALRLYNPAILLVGKHPEKLAIAGGQGVETFHIPTSAALPDLAETLGAFDIVIEATGRKEGVEQALNLVRPRGTLVLKSTVHSPSTLQLSRIVVNEISLIGSRCGDFDLALAFLKNKWVDVLPLIDRVYKLGDFKEAFDHARRPGSRKVLIRF